MDEFRKIFALPEIRTWLSAQDLQVEDPDVLFKLLDDGDKQLTAETRLFFFAESRAFRIA